MSDPDDNLNHSKRRVSNIPKPRPYHITNPFQDRGLWCFWLAANDDVLDFVSTLNCILMPALGSPFQRRMRGRVLFAINPRYDHEEVWLWINELLDSEANLVELDEYWESAIDEARASETRDGS